MRRLKRLIGYQGLVRISVFLVLQIAFTLLFEPGADAVIYEIGSIAPKSAGMVGAPW